jgi:hypothetical protein
MRNPANTAIIGKGNAANDDPLAYAISSVMSEPATDEIAILLKLKSCINIAPEQLIKDEKRIS